MLLCAMKLRHWGDAGMGCRSLVEENLGRIYKSSSHRTMATYFGPLLTLAEPGCS